MLWLKSIGFVVCIVQEKTILFAIFNKILRPFPLAELSLKDSWMLLVLCFRHSDYKVVSPALRAVGNIVTGDDLQTQVQVWSPNLG